MMVWRLPILASLVVAQDCLPHIQLLHVQQATSAWEPAMVSSTDMKDSIDEMIRDVKSDFFKFDYALATYSDKPAPLVGNGRQWSIWKDNPPLTDSSCYELHSSGFSEKVPRVDNVVTGNDSDQNQWDAMYRGAKDTTLGWNMDAGTPDKPVIRAIVVVTSDFSHLPDNDVDHDPGYALNSSYRTLNDYYISNFGKYYDDYFKYNQFIWGDFANSKSDWTTGDYNHKDVGGTTQYEALLMCTDRASVIDDDKDRISKSMQKLFGTKFGTTYDKGKWDAFCLEKDDVMPWALAPDYKLHETSSIADYNYDKPIDDCTLHEYPDPSSAEFKEGLSEFYAAVMPMPTGEHVKDLLHTYNGHVHCHKKYSAAGGDADKQAAAVGQCMLEHYNTRLGKLDKFVEMEGVVVQAIDTGVLAKQLKGLVLAMKGNACSNPPTTTTPAVTTTLGHYKTRGWARIWPIITIILTSLAVILLLAWACQCCHFYGCCCKKSVKDETARQQEAAAPPTQPTMVVMESVGATSDRQPSKSSSAIFKQSDKDLEEAHGS